MFVYFLWHVVAGDPCTEGPVLDPGPRYGFAFDATPPSDLVSQVTT